MERIERRLERLHEAGDCRARQELACLFDRPDGIPVAQRRTSSSRSQRSAARAGGRVTFMPFTHGFSTSALLRPLGFAGSREPLTRLVARNIKRTALFGRRRTPRERWRVVDVPE